MNKKSCNKRKKTVTVVIGPKTEEAMLAWCKTLESSGDGRLWSLTDLVGVMLRKEMRERIENEQMALSKSWVMMSE